MSVKGTIGGLSGNGLVQGRVFSCHLSSFTSRCYTVARCIILVVALLVQDNCLRQLSRTAKDLSSAKQLPQAVVSHCQGSCLALQNTLRRRCCNYSHFNGQLSLSTMLAS